MSLGLLKRRRALLLAAVAAIAALAAATPGAGAPPGLKQKEQQARQVLAQVNDLDIQLGRVGEQLNGAQYDLDQVRARERVTKLRLTTARKQYDVAQRRVAQRIVALYESNAPTTADAILGATSLSGILDRLRVVQAASSLDRRIVRDAEVRREQLTTHEQALTEERQRQAAAVAAIAAHRRTLDAELAQRRTLLSSIQGEVTRLKAEEAARQARIAAAARARLAAELKARAHAAAIARAEAVRAEAARKKAAVPPTPTTTSTVAVPPPTTTDPATATTAPPATTTPSTNPATTTTTTTPPSPPPPTAGGHPEAATIAMRYLGIPYVFGGATPSGFDCSGLVMYVFAQLGIQLPHYAAAQYGYGVPVPRAALQPGDLVFFDALGHVGIYIGGNEFVHAPQTGDVVKISSLSGWFADHYVGARRI